MGSRSKRASMVRGGLLYDKWWKVLEKDAPSGDHPAWSKQASNKRSGAGTHRCKECHGWDYKGAGGAYGSGSHYTGFAGVLDAGKKSEAQIKAALSQEGHDFSQMGPEALTDLTLFLKEGTADYAPFIEATSKTVKGDAAKGESMWRNCVECHGPQGKKINFGDASEPEYLGGIARGNPWEFFHKVRFGQPGTKMPSGIKKGWSLQEIADLAAFAQSLE